MKVTISIPAYNEARTLSKLVKEVKEVMNSTNYKYEIIVVNDGSNDETEKIAKSLDITIYSHPYNLGLAETFKTEIEKFLKSKADIFVHTDADGQYPSKYIPEMIKEVENGCDLVLGSRFYGGKYSGTLIKKLGNLAFAKVFSNLLKIKLRDTTTGFRAFNRKVASLPLINNFTYTQEQLIRTRKARLRIKEIPILTRKTRKSRLFRNPFDYALKAWVNILRIYRDYEPLKFFVFLGSIPFTLGVIIGILLFILFLIEGKIGHTPSLILSILLIIVGLQIVIFGFLADMIKSRLN